MTMYCGRLNGAWTHIRFWRRGAICQRSNRSDLEPTQRAGAEANPRTSTKLRGRSDGVNPLQARPAVEIGVEAEDRVNPVVLHDGDVDGIAGGKGSAMLHDLSGT